MKRVVVWVLIIVGLVAALPAATGVFTMLSAGRMADEHRQQVRALGSQPGPATAPPAR